MILDIIIAIALFVAGALLYTFGLMPVLLGFCTDVPLARRLKALYGGRVAAGAILMKAVYRAVFWAVILAAGTIAVIHWGGDYALFGWLGGIVLTLATTIGRLGVNRRNAAGFLVLCEKYMDRELSKALLEKVEQGDMSMKL